MSTPIKKKAPAKKKASAKRKAPAKKAPQKRGPKKKFYPDLTHVENLAALSCTDNELAAVYEVCQKTIQREKQDNPSFAEAVERGRNRGKVSLRRKQMEAAQGGNVTMLIWLGKQLLGQSEKSDITVENGNQLTPWSNISAGIDE